MTLQRSRMTLQGSRMTLQGSRMTLQGSRMTLQGSRMTLQGWVSLDYLRIPVLATVLAFYVLMTSVTLFRQHTVRLTSDGLDGEVRWEAIRAVRSRMARIEITHEVDHVDWPSEEMIITYDTSKLKIPKLTELFNLIVLHLRDRDLEFELENTQGWFFDG